MARKPQKGCSSCGAKANWLNVTPADMDKAMAEAKTDGGLMKALEKVPQYCSACFPSAQPVTPAGGGG